MLLNAALNSNANENYILGLKEEEEIKENLILIDKIN